MVNPYAPELGRIGPRELLDRVLENDRRYVGIHLPVLLLGLEGRLLLPLSGGILVLAALGWGARLHRPGVPRAVPAAVRGTVALLAPGLVRRALSPARPPADPRVRRYWPFPDLPPLRAAAHARRGPRDRVAGAGRGGARPARGGRAGRRVHPPLRGGGTLPVRGDRLARLLRAGGVVPPGAAGRRGGAVTQAAPVLPDQRPSGSSLPVQRESRYVLRRGAGRGGALRRPGLRGRAQRAVHRARADRSQRVVLHDAVVGPDTRGAVRHHGGFHERGGSAGRARGRGGRGIPVLPGGVLAGSAITGCRGHPGSDRGRVRRLRPVERAFTGGQRRT